MNSITLTPLPDGFVRVQMNCSLGEMLSVNITHLMSSQFANLPMLELQAAVLEATAAELSRYAGSIRQPAPSSTPG